MLMHTLRFQTLLSAGPVQLDRIQLKLHRPVYHLRRGDYFTTLGYRSVMDQRFLRSMNLGSQQRILPGSS
jgi:hypothetical protein